MGSLCAFIAGAKEVVNNPATARLRTTLMILAFIKKHSFLVK
jgi:hypothetical protein